jgi:hypothetical protein
MQALPSGRLEAGSDFLAALKKLGLEPDGLLWAYDTTFDEFVLVMITAQFDFVGPRAIYELLTTAYKLEATPQAVSPFIVRIHSPNQQVVTELRKAYGWDIRVDPIVEREGVHAWATVELKVGDLTFQMDWVYFIRDKKVRPVERSRRWARFQRTVEALAA